MKKATLKSSEGIKSLRRGTVRLKDGVFSSTFRRAVPLSFYGG